MTHRSSFLLPPPVTVTGAGSGSLPATYALIILNQRLPRFSPLLWDHEQLDCVCVLMAERIGCLMACRRSVDVERMCAVFAKGPVEELETNNISIADFASPESEIPKDLLSCTGDNETPISDAEVVAKTLDVDVKRKLADVYDLEDASAMSSSKPTLNGKETSGASKKLLIPKLEK